jgi:hypothetical protein
VFLGMTDLTVLLSLVSLERRFDVDAEIVLPDQSRLAIYAGGEPGTQGNWLAQIAAGNYQFGLDFEHVPFEVARPWLSWVGVEPPKGSISAVVRGAGTLSSPFFDIHSKVEGLELAPWPRLDIELDAEHDGKRASLRLLRVADELGDIGRLTGFIDARPDELVDPVALRSSLTERPLELALTWEDRRLDELPLPLRVELAMPSWGSLRIVQTERGPALDLSTRLGWSETTEGLDSCGAFRHPQLELTLHAHDLRTTGKLTAGLDGEQLAMADVEADTPILAWLTGEQPLFLPRTSFTLDAQTSATEEVPYLCEYMAGPLQLSVSALDAFADPPELRIEVRSTALQMVANRHQQQRFGSQDAARQAGRAFALNASANVEGPSFLFRGTVDQGEGSTLSLEGSYPRAALGGNFDEALGWPLASFAIDAHRLELSSLLVALPASVRTSGKLEGKAQLRYDFASDVVGMSGAFSLSEGRLVLGALGQELSEVGGRLVLHDDVIEIEKLSARDFDGRLEIGGKLTVAGRSELRTELALDMKDFPIRRESAQVSRLTGGMQLRATTGPDRTRAELTFGELRVNLPNDLGQGLQGLDPHGDIVVRGEEVETADSDPYALELRVVADDPPFRVLRSDLTADVAADLTVRYRSPELTLQGGAEIERGNFELYGKRFDLRASRLSFDGKEDIDPLVSIDAVHRTSGVEIGVRVEGRLSDPRISFSHSDPTITEPGEIIAQLLGARSRDVGTENRDATGAAAGILAGATAGLLTQEVREQFGGALPVLSLESNSQTLRSARIRAGVQLDQLIERRLGALRHVVRGAYVEGFVAPGASSDTLTIDSQPQSRGGGLLELRFPKDLVGTIEYRPIQNWRLDLAWEP